MNVFRTHPTIATLVITIAIFAAILYLPPLFDSPKEAVMRSMRECSWAIQTNSSIYSKCDSFIEKAEKHMPRAEAWLAGDIWMQIAEYRLVRREVAPSKFACHQALLGYKKIKLGQPSNAENAKKICEALFVKYGY